MELEIERALLAGQGLGDAGQRMAETRRSVGGRIEAANQQRPWGGDDLGAAFAQNYAAAAAEILEVWEAAARRTAQLGTEIVTAVDATVAADEAARQRLTRASAPTPPTPRAPHPG